jgi:ammonia channel protein AmtB
MYGKVVEKVGMSPFRIMLAIQNTFGYEISYDMVWRAKLLASEMRFGTYKDSYHHLPAL